MKKIWKMVGKSKNLGRMGPRLWNQSRASQSTTKHWRQTSCFRPNIQRQRIPQSFAARPPYCKASHLQWSLSGLNFLLLHDWPVRHTEESGVIPVWIPIRSSSLSSGRWRIRKDLTSCSRRRAIRQISRACRKPLTIGRPETTTYASPIVSTWTDRRQIVSGGSKGWPGQATHPCQSSAPSHCAATKNWLQHSNGT